MREHNLASEVAGTEPAPIRYGLDVATRWSYSQISSQDRTAAAAWATTTLAFAGELGLEAGAYAT
jgi:hypothetical protein